ncbi:MAG: HAD hydrolase-like protein [Melioribacteraceae bacterium]|nr:HAD hydrolase-like protein [Melioribacteraceae bacterium]
MIGDTIHDYEVAQEIGADCLLTAEGHQSYERLASTGCKVINSLTELI